MTDRTAAYVTSPVRGDFDLGFNVDIRDREALHAYMAQYPEDWTDERTIIKAFIWQSYNYNQRRDPAGTDGFADLPEGIVWVTWDEPHRLDIYHDGEWW